MTHPASGADPDGHPNSPGSTDGWESSLAQAFGVLLGRPLSAYDADAEYGTFYGGNWLDETGVNRDPAWLVPAVLTGRETIAFEPLMLLDEPGFPELRFDASRSFFEVDTDHLPPAFAADLAATPLPGGVIRGDDLACLLDRHGLDLTAPDVSAATWSLRQARIASNGTLLDALRVATGIGPDRDSLVPYTKPHMWATGTEEHAEAAIAAVSDAELRAHLRTFSEPGSHDLDHQAVATKTGDWSGWQENEWAGVGTLVTQWLGAVDQYTVSVVRVAGPGVGGHGD